MSTFLPSFSFEPFRLEKSFTIVILHFEHMDMLKSEKCTFAFHPGLCLAMLAARESMARPLPFSIFQPFMKLWCNTLLEKWTKNINITLNKLLSQHSCKNNQVKKSIPELPVYPDDSLFSLELNVILIFLVITALLFIMTLTFKPASWSA